MAIPAATMSNWPAFSAGISCPNSTCVASTLSTPIALNTALATSGASPVTSPPSV
jgi:hypothetical protein